MASTLERCIDNSQMTPNQCEPTRKSSGRKSLRQFSEALNVKHNNSVCGLGAAKAKRKSSELINRRWSNN